MQKFVDTDLSKRFKVSQVNFDRGVRNKFHTHTIEQVLIVTEGKGIVATDKEEITVVPGDIIFSAPVFSEQGETLARGCQGSHLLPPLRPVVKIHKGCGRPMIGLSFYDGLIKTQALVDTGAMSSVISEDLVKEIEDTGIKVLRTNEKFTVEGIIPDARNKHLEGVLLDVTVGGKLKLDNVPFIVMKSKDIILGMNVIKACRLSTGYDKDGDLFIQVMNENRLENVSVCIDHEELEVVNVNEVTIHPNSFGVIDLEIPRLRYLPKNNINNTNVLVEGNEEILDDKDLFIIPSVSRVIRGRLKVIFKNNTSNSFKMPNGLPIAKICDASQLDNFATKKDWVNFGEFSRVAIGLKTIPQFTAQRVPM